MQDNVYKQNGYKDRDDYLETLAKEHDVPKMALYMLADMLGPSEDFDGLLDAIEDI